MTHPQTLIGAIDIGGTKMAIGLVDASGCIHQRRELATEFFSDWKTGVEAIAISLGQCLQESGAELAGIGIGCTGPVDPITGVIGKVANLPGWEGCPLVAELANRFNVVVGMENDADTAAMAEATWGSGRNVDRFLYVTLSTGIGTGFIVDGRVYRGVDGSHPEMGHHAIDPAGPKCYCGAHGCWESLASGNALKSWYLDRDESRRFSPSSFSARTLFELYKSGDSLATRAVDRLCLYLGIGLANMITMLVPAKIALGGGLMHSSEFFLDRALQIVRNTCLEVPVNKIVVTSATLGSDAGLIGAAAVWKATGAAFGASHR